MKYLLILFFISTALGSAQDRPNILWITCEDISPFLGCYGFEQAHTPHLDQLASQGIRFTNAYAPAPVCAVARSALLTGMHSPTLGTQHMRSKVQVPEEIPAYPKLFRQAGYYTTNKTKKDYNSNLSSDPSLWDDDETSAHWRNRAPNQPFFAVINFTESHESRLAQNRINGAVKSGVIPDRPRIAPSEIALPPYHPDLPEIREDWARLHDLITHMDSLVGKVLAELKEDNLEDDTIVLFYSDHGGMLARSKRYIYNVGTQVPMIARFPEKYQHLAPSEPGSVFEEMVTFVDLPRTMLSIAGLEVPGLMQGRVFLGPQKESAPPINHFYRDRMAERFDLCRAATDGQFYYIRNFMPHRPRGRDSTYGYTVQANWRAWLEAFESEKCDAIQSQFYRPKPVIQFFDTTNDPWQIDNLANKPEHRQQITTLENSLDAWMIENRDLGLIPEVLYHELAGPNMEFKTIYEYGQSDHFPVREVLESAKKASLADPAFTYEYLVMLSHKHPAIRHWGAYAFFLTKDSSNETREALRKQIAEDAFPGNRIMAAQAMAVNGDPDAAFAALMKETESAAHSTSFLLALNAFDYAGLNDRLTQADWNRWNALEFPKDHAAIDRTNASYVKRLIQSNLN